MARYINKYADATAIQSAIDGNELSKPYVAYDESAGTIDWNTKSPTPPAPVYENEYLTFEIISAGTIVWKTSSELDNQKTISYSTDNGSSWTNITSTQEGVSFNVNAGDVIKFKGLNSAYGNDGPSYNTFEGSTAIYNVYGNIMSLIYGDNFTGQTALTTTFTFYQLFFNCQGLVDASNLVLPATTLTTYCYANLFYYDMSLTAAPELPATELANYCYNEMFNNCSSLTTAPELPATTLATNCYNMMFVSCSNLNYVKCLATDISANGTSYWLYGVASTGTFVKDANMSDWETGESGIPSNWTVENN